MRSALLFALVVAAGCSDSPNRQEFDNLSRQALLDHDRITELATGKPAGMGTLSSDVAELRQQVAALAAENQALKSEMAKVATARKVPHLVARDTGVDYGPSIDGALAAWNEEHAAVIDFAPPRDVFFTGPNCTGTPLFMNNVSVEAKYNRYLFIGDGRLVQVIGAARENFPDGSAMDGTGSCVSQPGVGGLRGAIAPFSVPRPSVDSLVIRAL